MNSYKELVVWRKAIDLVLEIYKITRLFTHDEKFGLVSQMRRAAVSIPSNISEGFARRNKKENAYFVSVAFGSASELETQIIISKKLGLIKNEAYLIIDSTLAEILKMLYAYRASLQSLHRSL